MNHLFHEAKQSKSRACVCNEQETSVEKDLADRADAARRDFEDQDKISDAMEAAMESVDDAEKDMEVRDQRLKMN